ncbi:hypothetical protein [Fimbriiglobus ruber]|uniref:Uncharacterized protein n=1 Tax=Fimbriiglobus ruber TaxID=1908690 RepID=A0A225DN07_9BACT|nr:hypothetical protein [Fimbriiglobus ruber]OWK39938.1 hypothetical protein FRUB_05828 [Fimbriiglobus ruber]
MHLGLDPSELTSSDRLRAVATILAAGLRRLHNHNGLRTDPPRQNLSDSRTNELALTPDTSVTVHGG